MNTYLYHKDGRYDNNEESVYNLIERPAEEQQKEKMYRSQYPKDTPPTASTFCLKGTSKKTTTNLAGDYNHPDNHGSMHFMKKDNATIGRTTKHNINTETFLKKGDKTLNRPKIFKYADHDNRKPGVPKKDERPIMGLTTDKNFIVSNAIETILAQPKKPRDSPLLYTQKPEYGKSPDYLNKIKEEIEREKAYIAELHERHKHNGGREMRLLSHSEREKLIEGLKDKWAEIHKKYQSISFSMPIDKVHINRKEALEAQMDDIEKDIERLSKENIYVYNDQ
jgi:hypothetical protein